MKKLITGIFSTLLIIYIVPFVIYGSVNAVFGLNPPEGTSPEVFLIGILISKIGAAIAITLFFHYSKSFFYEKWFLYVSIWWIMFVIGEVGQAIGPNYSSIEALAGIFSETIYLPLSVLALRKLLK